VGGVADHPDAAWVEVDAVGLAGPPQAVGPELVPELAFVAEGPERKVPPKPVVGELDLGPPAEVARQKPLGHAGPAPGRLHKVAGPRKDPGLGGVHLGRQEPEVGLAVAGEVLLRGGNPELRENLADDPAVGPAGKVYVVQQPADPELLKKRRRESPPARTA